MKWSDQYFIRNLSRFYGTSLQNCEAKAAHCGKGEFLLVIVKDDNPIYGIRNASSGIKNLNTNTFDCKEKFRELTGGGHRVHATDDEKETNHDITLLLNKSIKDFLEENLNEWDGQIEEINKELFGYNGWKNAEEMFYALNNCTKYAVLRNYEGLPEEIYINEHNDIDLICESKENCAYILNAEKVFPEEYRIHYRAKVGDKYANFDLRYVGDNYYFKEIEKNILENRVYNEKGFFVLNPENYYYTLMYHALIHKKIFKPDYKTRLINMSNQITENTTTEEMLQILKKWLQTNKYLITIPKDKSVDFNMKNASKLKPLLEIENTNNNLKEFNANIVKWYPFENMTNMLLIGENEEIGNYLNIITDKLTVISRFEEIPENLEKGIFKYILVYGIEKYSNIISKLKEYLSEDGKLLIIGKNTFGINNWSKYNVNENIGINKLERHRLENTNIKQIKEEIKENGLDEINVFYTFPNYKETELIINEKMQLQKSQIEKYYPSIEENEIKLFDEIKVLKNIVKNQPEMLGFFANSFFIEVSKNKIETDIRYVSYNNCRKPKYRLITIIKDEIVQKLPANEIAKEHIENMKKAIQDVKSSNIEILDYEENGAIYSKLIKNEKTLDELLGENYNNLEYVVKILNDLKEILLKNTVENFKVKAELKGLHFMPKAFWDMVPKNCFYIDNKYVFFDQEWEKENLPVEFIIYRAIINSYDLVRRINVDKLLEELDILKYKKYFEELDEEIRKEIIDENIYKEIYCKNVKTIDNLINECNIDKIQMKQIKEDNSKKQEYINMLEEDNRKKQEYINMLEEKNRINEEKLKNRFFWKGKK